MENDLVGMFKDGMRHLASGVSIVCTMHEGSRYGFVATSVSSLSIDPPSLLVCLNRNASAYPPILASGVFSVGIIGSQDKLLAERFAQAKTRALCFSSDIWVELATGSPVLNTAIVNFDCQVSNIFQYYTHAIIVGTVVETTICENARDHLIYVDRNYHKVAQLGS